MRDRISVLMPVRDGRWTAPLAARSTLRALAPDDELLVHDDASHDDTVALLERLRDPRIRIVRADEPVGVAVGLNRLLAEASGALVARMDADDVTLPWRFALQRAAIARGTDLVFTGHVRFGRSVHDFRQKRPGALSAEITRIWLALENPLLHPSMLARAGVLRRLDGYRSGGAEDYDLWLRAAADGARIERLAMPALAYRMHDGQVTRSADYAVRVLGDVELAGAHTALAQSLGWTGGPVWDVLGTVPTTAEAWARKRDYWSFLHRLVAGRGGPVQRRAFLATARRAWPGVPVPSDAEVVPER